MNNSLMQGKWNEIKGEIRNTWGNISGDELEQSKGNLTAIAGLIQQKYAHKKEEVSAKLDGIVARFGAAAEDVKKTAAQTTESIKNDLKKKNV